MAHVPPLEAVTLILTVDPNTGVLRHTRVEGQTEFDFPEYKLTVTKADFSPASTSIKYVVTTKPGAKRGLGDKGAPTLALELLDQNDNPIELSWSGGGATLDDGTEQMEWASLGAPLAQVPDEITLMPYNQAAFFESSGDPSSYFYTEEAMRLKIVPNERSAFLKIFPAAIPIGFAAGTALERMQLRQYLISSNYYVRCCVYPVFSH